MKLASLIFTASISFAYSSQQAKAPEVKPTQRDFEIIGNAFAQVDRGEGFMSKMYKNPRKIIYDRIVQEEPVRMQRCKTPHTVWYHDGKCYRIERLPS